MNNLKRKPHLVDASVWWEVMERLQTRPILIISGLSVISAYCLFTLLAWIFYPLDFSPTTHYLSRLGNFEISPFGAIFYNLGCILTGLSLIPFFIGFRLWYRSQMRLNLVISIGQGLGILSGGALVMIGVFSENQGEPHMLATSIFFLLNFFVLIVFSIAFLFHDRALKVIPLYGILLDIMTLVLEFQIGGPIVEWITVFGSLLFVTLVILDTYRLARYFSESERFNLNSS